MKLYTITSDLFGDADQPVSYYDAQHLVSTIVYAGWIMDVYESGDELRMTCERNGSEDNSPSVYTDWTMVTDDDGYIVIGEAV